MPAQPDSDSGRRWLAGIGLACFAAIAAALVAQHAFGMQPCPWCILQRLICLAIALLALIAAACRRPLRTLLAGSVAALALAGATAAVYQHVVAAKQYSCNLTFADTVITALGVERLWPAVFQVTATCADAAVSVLGVPFEYWSLALFVLVAAATAHVLTRRGNRTQRR
jgi:disulfide bond formation protein DsbB